VSFCITEIHWNLQSRLQNRVKFGPAADLGDPAVGTALAWSACMYIQSPPLKALRALRPLGSPPRGRGVAGGDDARTPTGNAPLGCPPR
jgi:hypothetical protein